MLLTEHNIFYYLLDKGMINSTPVLEGEFTVHRSDSRNNNFIINREFGHHTFFIKQVKALDTEKIETMRVEATAYWLANTDLQYKALKEFLPKYFYYDSMNHILVVEQVKDSMSVYDYYLQVEEFNTALPQQIADILASFHKTVNPAASQQNAGFQYFRKQTPWVFTIAGNPAANFAGTAQSADQQIMQMILKNNEFVQLMAQASNEWQATSLIHNDAKFNNFLIGYEPDKKTIRQIKLIDWELADIGDPLWDVASVIQNYLTLWLTTDQPEQGHHSNMKKITLQQVQPCIYQFWQRYLQQMNWPASHNHAALAKVARFCALKLIHTAFETTPYTKTLHPLTVRMLQMSLNILRSPAEAATKLLGIK